VNGRCINRAFRRLGIHKTRHVFLLASHRWCIRSWSSGHHDADYISDKRNSSNAHRHADHKRGIYNGSSAPLHICGFLPPRYSFAFFSDKSLYSLQNASRVSVSLSAFGSLRALNFLWLSASCLASRYRQVFLKQNPKVGRKILSVARTEVDSPSVDNLLR